MVNGTFMVKRSLPFDNLARRTVEMCATMRDDVAAATLRHAGFFRAAAAAAAAPTRDCAPIGEGLRTDRPCRGRAGYFREGSGCRAGSGGRENGGGREAIGCRAGSG